MKKWAYILIIAIILTFGFAGYKLFLTLSHPVKFESEILLYSSEFNLKPSVVASIINIESSYRKNAKSNRNAIGLMQIKLETANYLNMLYGHENLTEEELFKPNINIKYGCMYIRYLMNKFEDEETALCAYNAGETRVRSWLKSNYSPDGKTLDFIPYKETKNYIIKYKQNLKFYKKVY